MKVIRARKRVVEAEEGTPIKLKSWQRTAKCRLTGWLSRGLHSQT
jgi:hypothetical protein